ncbi:winged helix-turn-helix transcriptional regulator (plasmid) [Halolamina sp. CBA1230]|uniref:winged helix-turn-helix domain-containing protein n=1 Tax=Halolamina sp. CBA1230 TaxID=1853690 RepID=UPI0009A19743|nr:winged helix-turn-helix domain-containing protein [Halolamina sp. CBA1230]QKY21803.1 winged helix-turn-helix transcriptional regulator [Halolamina sp. CBA1230]
MSEDPSVETLLSALDDEYARTILMETDQRPMSAKNLAEACDASLPTIYRRIDRLSELGLVTERPEFSDEGRHYSVYEATLDQVVIDLDDGDLSVTMTAERTDAADRFTEMWEDI